MAANIIEHFETYDEQGCGTGLYPRDQVHAEGLWHRSAHLFLFTPEGDLWVQRRAADKDIYPGRWDYSVGEHLKPGESYREGALRGLQEELGVPELELRRLGEVRRSITAIPEQGILDRELQQAFTATWPGPVEPDPVEVDCVRHLTLAALARWIFQEPQAFTPWFLRELKAMRILSGAPRG